MGYEKLIKSWHLKAGTEDYFSKFVFEYLAFIAYVNSSMGEGNDRAAIQRLKRADEIKKKYLKKIKTGKRLRQSWHIIKKTLDETPLGRAVGDSNSAEEIPRWNCSHDRVNQKTDEERRKRSGVIHSFDDWENMVEFWYSVRNNLFHGKKSPERKRDEFAVKYGFRTLRPLVDIFVKDLEE